MKRTRTPSIFLALVGIAILVVSIAPSLAPQPAYAGSNDPSVLPVLLVHGYEGWGNSKSDWVGGGWISKNGLTEVRPHGTGWAVYKEKGSPGIFDKAPVYSLDYHGYHDAKGHLKQNAGILAKALDVVTGNSGADEVYVIAHSQGGLMTRAVLMGLALDPDDGSAIDYNNNIFGFMTIDSPHRGSSSGVLRVGDWVGVDAAKDMLAGSDFLKELNEVPTTIDGATFCSVVVGNAWTTRALGPGDGLFTATEQTPITGTLPSSTKTSPFPVVHGNGNTYHGTFTPALKSSEVKDWAIKQYRKAAKKYWELNSLSTGSNTVLVIDVSGTMSNEYQGEIKLTQAKNAANDVAGIIAGYGNMTKTGAQVAVSSFSDAAATVQPLTSNVDAIRASVDSLQTQNMTNVGAGIEDGIAQLGAAKTGAEKVMILLSDGQNNTGMTNDEVLAGPVAEAAQKHIKIFTVGFGDVGDLDPDFLQEIADATGGEYQLADATSVANNVAGKFVLAQVAATQKVLAQNQGTVAQGETTEAGTFAVPTTSGDVQAVLLWPGSTLRLDLTDPTGVKVGPGYPGYKQSTGDGPAQIVVQGAKAGTWTSSVYGEQVSMAEEPFYSIVSFKKVKRAAAVSGGGAGNNSGAGIIIAVILVAVGVGIAWLVVAAVRERPSERSTGAGGFALGSLDTVATSPAAFLVDDRGGRYPLQRGPNTVGRELGNDVMLDAPSVSRRHALLTLSTRGLEVRDAGSAAGLFINGERVSSGSGVQVTDLGSTGGVLINGLPIACASARDGDELRFGEVTLRLRMGPSPSPRID